MRPTVIMAVCLLVVSTVASPAVTAADDAFSLDPVAPGIFVHPGRHADLDDPGRGDSANLGLIVGERCVAVIDTGGSIATGTAFAAAIERVTDTPVCYVINTHVHFDHVLGNAAFVRPGTEFVGHRELAEAMAANREFFAESFAAELGGPGLSSRVVVPTRLVEERLDLDLGGRTLVLTALPPAHTITDISVLDVTTSTLFAGDLLFRERMPVLDGSLRGWLGWMDQAMAEPYALVVPGHGPPDPAWPAGAKAQYRYLKAVLDDTRAAVAAGTLPADAQDAVAAGEPEHWLLTERAHRLNVSRALRELEWE